MMSAFSYQDCHSRCLLLWVQVLWQSAVLAAVRVVTKKAEQVVEGAEAGEEVVVVGEVDHLEHL